MSDKFFYKGKPPKKPQHGAKKYSDGKESKPGSEAYPVNVSVQTEERKLEIEALLQENNLFAVIAVDSDQPENIVELESLIQTPKTIVLEKVPGRNEACSCGSGKKYKKCCG